MNRHHKTLLTEIKKISNRDKPIFKENNYSGSPHPIWGLSVPQQRKIAQTWTETNKNINLTNLLNLLDSLYKGQSLEERKIAGQILQYMPNLRKDINPILLESWLETLQGWEEIDSLCQSVFSYKDISAKKDEWHKLIRRLYKNQNMSHKRASLVLLTFPVLQSDNKELANLSFETIDKLKFEKNILITKALSWLLRHLIEHHKNEVKTYLNKNLLQISRIAVRETGNKLTAEK
ncbi:MAG: DNA alkylation repair protein [Patescibacteria group bacterium]|nr:DNA alkylation repair protein [Patescibacteria group bacterium]